MTDAFAAEQSEPSVQAALRLWSDFYGQMGDVFHPEASAPFVYSPAWEPGSASSSGASGFQPAPAVADAVQQFFDGWINTLASWTQAGTATVGQQGDHIENTMLVANGYPLVTRGGWS
ncbi:hypothetical protein DBIPINDM_001372 [Mesorhizobium sp. AR02]|uniref:hypothetical protein n=1 Tax=Mesorhizobium sp. AR02 TaxID=2865837 RepID=UPI00215DDC55|nr:hypothetical protein [Mesorhizobium sp. AR02]UVK54896.1 hypothetical protein DBIPINDM_001372 [Mesorhizobium sp. AR02]